MTKLLLFWIIYFHIFLSKVMPFFISKKKSENSILYLPTFFPNNAGYIYRVQKWKEKLEEGGYEVDIKQALTEKQFYSFLEKKDVRFYIIPVIKRTWQIIASRKYNTVIVRREILLFNDYGNLFLEKLLLKIHPNAILDFDDDISYAKNEPREITSFYGKMMLENGKKFEESLKLYRKFIVGSNYLKDLVSSINTNLLNEDVCVIPTCVDYDTLPPKNYSDIENKQTISLGWIGSNGNLKYLDSIVNDLNKLNQVHPIRLIVISGMDFSPKADFEIENRRWGSETQIDDLLKIDVGLMPLFNTREDKGKCGFKLIQYMGLGIVSVASSVTVNTEIITDRKNGYLVSVEKNNWLETLIEVIENKNNFSEMGLLASQIIEDNYSFVANTQKYSTFIEDVR